MHSAFKKILNKNTHKKSCKRGELFSSLPDPIFDISKLKIVNISVAASAHSLTFHLHVLYDISQHSCLYKYI